MLLNIPKIMSPELLKVLCEMGHGDEIVIADGNFPSMSVGKNAKVIRMDGHGGVEVLKAIMELFPLDMVANNYSAVMATGTKDIPPIWKEYEKVLKNHGFDKPSEEVERFAFYERARKAYCIIATSEPMLFANLILKKGTV